MNMNMKVNVNVHEIVYIRIHSKGRCSMRITRKHINWHHLRWPTTMYVDTAVGAIQNGGTTKNHICHFGRYGLYDHVGVSLFEINPQICMSKKNKHTYIHTYIYILLYVYVYCPPEALQNVGLWGGCWPYIYIYTIHFLFGIHNPSRKNHRPGWLHVFSSVLVANAHTECSKKTSRIKTNQYTV